MEQATMAFFSYGANLVAQGADSYLTGAGLAKGFTEGNPVTRFLIKKIGQAGAGFVKIGAIPFLGILIPLMLSKPQYANEFNFTMAAVTIPAVVWNFVQLRRKGISILST